MSTAEYIRSLQAASAALEPGPAARAALHASVNDYAESFLDSLPERKAYVLDTARGAGLLEHPVSEDAHSPELLLELLGAHVDHPGLNPASGGHLGYIPGGGIYASALGDFLADVTNRYAGVFFGSPGAVRMENMMVRWMAGIAGYPAEAVGHLSSGGSIANLTGIVAARDAMAPEPEELRRCTLYLTAQVHHSVHKALRIAGLSWCPVRHVPMDAHFRMDAQALEAQILADKAAGFRPLLLIGSIGTTDTGAIDPIPELAQIAEAHGLWLHLDGAYGGFFLLTEEGQARIRDVHRSHSLVMDPHKGLFLPYGTGAVLVRDRRALMHSHYYQAPYMQDTLSATEEYSPADLSPELTKHFRGLRMWLPLMLYGVAPFRAALQEKLALARYFHQKVQEIPGMEVGPDPDLSVVLYRYVPKHGDADAFNEALIRAVHADGRVFLSSTRVNGRFYLRLACLCFRTHLDTIETTLEMLRTHITRLQG